jgi:hydroxymethylpyrimidine/phosphomethylpyrimidine kinase
MVIPNVLTIAGSDSGGGAGIQADLKTFSALHTFGTSVLAALTAQNTRRVTAIHVVPEGFMRAQIDAVFEDIAIAAVKVGMLASAAIIEEVVDGLRRHAPAHVVIDPVMVAKSGDRLLTPDAMNALRRALALASVVTPNLPEAGALLDERPPRNVDEMRRAGRAILALGPKAVLMKGGHLEGPDLVDLLIDAEGELCLPARRHVTRNTHGTGCTLSSALTAYLAWGVPLREATARATAYVGAAIRAADELSVGSGAGPVHHFHALWARTPPGTGKPTSAGGSFLRARLVGAPPHVVAVTDRRLMVPPELLAAGEWGAVAAVFGDAVARAVAGCPSGSVVIQVREKDLGGGPLFQLVRAAQPFAPVVVNERIDVAIAADAFGVHLPERGLTVERARALAPALQIGVSRHVAPGDTGADLVQLGPIWSTPSKPDATPLGEAVLAGPHGRATLVAVGGIDSPERAARAAAAGADAVAVIRAAWTGASLAPFVAAVESSRVSPS